MADGDEVEEPSKDGSPSRSTSDNKSDEAVAPEKTDTQDKEGVQTQEKGNVVKYDQKASYRNKTSLSSVLNEYGLNEHKDKKVKKKKKKRKVQIFEDKDEREEERERMRKERYMEVYEEIHRLRDYYYADYMEALRNKITRQRINIQKKSDEIAKKVHESKRQQKLASMKTRPQMKRIDMQHDDAFLKKVPKSQFYKIVNLEDKMRAEGKIKNQEELDHFWSTIRQPEIWRSYFSQSSKTGSEPASGYTSAMSDPLLPAKGKGETMPPLPDFRPMTQIEEVKEMSRPVTRDVTRMSGKDSSKSWAVTGQYHAKHKEQRHDPYTIARHAAIELDKKFPQLPLPQLTCFTFELGEKPPDPVEVQRELEANQRRNERNKFVKKLRKMYHLAASNSATTKRILGKHEHDLMGITDGPGVEDLISSQFFAPISVADSESSLTDPQPWMRYVRGKAIDPIMEAEEDDQPMSRRNLSPPKKSPASRRPEPPSSAPAAVEKPPPLSKKQITGDKVIEAKCLSTFWHNYSQTGSAY